MKSACVIGWPISHSRSPLIHGYWLSLHGIAGSYERVPVAPDALGAFLESVRDGRYVGCNVTVPHKEAVIAGLDEVLPEARAIGTVNTIWRDGRRLIATSTDGAGFIAHLDASAPDWQDREGTILVLGAGGAARAIVDAFLRRGERDIRIANRTRSRADAIAEEMPKAHGSAAAIAAIDWDQREQAAADAKLIVNTTALGMTGKDRLDFDLRHARLGTVVVDIVYAPLETELLKSARRSGLVAVDGLGMLLHQAAPGFERWFGVRPDVTDDLRALVVRDLDATH